MTLIYSCFVELLLGGFGRHFYLYGIGFCFDSYGSRGVELTGRHFYGSRGSDGLCAELCCVGFTGHSVNRED